MSELKLSRAQRAAFFAREWPELAGEGKSPVLPGYIHTLSSRLSFEVLRVHKTKRHGWRLHYRVIDDREERFFLLPTARSLHVDDTGQPLEMAPEEEIGYTRDPRRVRADWPPCVPPNLHNVMTMKSRLDNAEFNESERGEELSRRDARQLTAVIKDNVATMIKAGVDPKPMLIDLRRTLERHEDQREAA